MQATQSDGKDKRSRSEYKPFHKYQVDLKLLITLRSMFAKSLTNLGKPWYNNLAGLNLIHDAVYMGILFAIDCQERKIMLSNLEYVQKIVHQVQST